MIIPKSYVEIADLLEREDRLVLFFAADWCPDCHFIYPVMPEIEAENPDCTFIRIDRDEFMAMAEQLNIFGIPSFVVVENGKEIGRLVNRLRKTIEEVNSFLAGL